MKIIFCDPGSSHLRVSELTARRFAADINNLTIQEKRILRKTVLKARVIAETNIKKASPAAAIAITNRAYEVERYFRDLGVDLPEWEFHPDVASAPKKALRNFKLWLFRYAGRVRSSLYPSLN